MAGPTDSPIAAARARADAELKKALSVLDPNDFSSNVPAFHAFIDSTKLLFNEEAAELLHTRTEFATFKHDLRGLRERVVDEYTKPPKRKLTKRQRRRLERPIDLDKRLPVVPADKWDLFAPTSLLPNKKYSVRDELKRVLGEQLPYWLQKAARQFDRQRAAAGNKSSSESPRTPGVTEGAIEPLVELPPEAKARIRVKEAKAEKQYALERQACERNVAKAHEQWGGYIDLHQEQLRDAEETARANIDAVATLAAKYLFEAHAAEYRNVLIDPRELETVLANLREALIAQYGSHARASIQTCEALIMERVEKWAAFFGTAQERLASLAQVEVYDPSRFITWFDSLAEEALELFFRDHEDG